MFSTTTSVTIGRGCKTFLTNIKEYTDSQWWMSESAYLVRGRECQALFDTHGCRGGVFEHFEFEPRTSKATSPDQASPAFIPVA